MTKTRMEAFSDGVLAIIITIMVLELKVPHGADAAALRPLLPIFFSYVLSFVYIGIYWNNHHHLLHAAHQVNGRILWANLHLLFWLSLVPVRDRLDGRESFRGRARGIVRRGSAPGRSRLLSVEQSAHSTSRTRLNAGQIDRIGQEGNVIRRHLCGGDSCVILATVDCLRLVCSGGRYVAHSRPTYREEFGVRAVTSLSRTLRAASIPKGCRKVARGKRSAAPGHRPKKDRVLEGRQTQRVGQSGEVSRPFQGAGLLHQTFQGLRFRLPLATFCIPSGCEQFPFVQERLAVIRPDLYEIPNLAFT